MGLIRVGGPADASVVRRYQLSPVNDYAVRTLNRPPPVLAIVLNELDRASVIERRQFLRDHSV